MIIYMPPCMLPGWAKWGAHCSSRGLRWSFLEFNVSLSLHVILDLLGARKRPSLGSCIMEWVIISLLGAMNSQIYRVLGQALLQGSCRVPLSKRSRRMGFTHAGEWRTIVRPHLHLPQRRRGIFAGDAAVPISGSFCRRQRLTRLRSRWNTGKPPDKWPRR